MQVILIQQNGVIMTLDDALNLQWRATLIHIPSGQRWRVNGKVKTWKRDASRIKIPLKRGLYVYGTLTAENLADFLVE